MDWFKRLTGFREGSYAETQARFELLGDRLRSRVNGRSLGAGRLELISLGQLRARVAEDAAPRAPLRFRNVIGDVRALHSAPDYAGALFQVASQFNLLEMVGPSVSPEGGVTRYQGDPTQGPACAMAAAGGLIFRNYFAPVGGGVGQTRDRQLDGLADLMAAIAASAGRPASELLTMRNGYAFCTEQRLGAIDRVLAAAPDTELDAFRARLRVGLHADLEATDETAPPGQIVSQVYCSALPVSYNPVSTPDQWRRFAGLVLEAAYEATLLAGVLNARRGASDVVLLTRLGGGAFGNDGQWIDDAMRRALKLHAESGLDVRLVSFRAPPPSMIELEQALS